jgi:hypothetical protein
MPMPNYEPTSEMNRRVRVFIRIKDSVNNLPEVISSDIAK